MSKQFQVTRTIAVLADKIWALLTNSSGYRAWQPSIVSLDGRIAQVRQ
jgi:uncharacterized protein YndB with AHSA1/START domain